MASISFNPMLTTSPSGNFLALTDGYVQGDFLADPSAQQWLTTAFVASTVTGALWSGTPITETTPASSTAGTAGNFRTVTAATAAANITGFIVNNQAYNGIITTSSNVPLYYAGQTVSILRMGSQARIVVAVDSGSITALTNVAVNASVYWDFTTNALQSSGTGALPVKFLGLTSNSKLISYNSSTLAANWTSGTAAIIEI